MIARGTAMIGGSIALLCVERITGLFGGRTDRVSGKLPARLGQEKVAP